MLNETKLKKCDIAQALHTAVVSERLTLSIEDCFILVDKYFSVLKELVVNGNITSLFPDNDIYPKYVRQLMAPVKVLGYKLYNYKKDALVISVSSQVSYSNHIWDVKTKQDVIEVFADKAKLTVKDATSISNVIRRELKSAIDSKRGIYIMDFFTVYHNEERRSTSMKTRGHTPIKPQLTNLMDSNLRALRKNNPIAEDRFLGV